MKVIPIGTNMGLRQIFRCIVSFRHLVLVIYFAPAFFLHFTVRIVDYCKYTYQFLEVWILTPPVSPIQIGPFNENFGQMDSPLMEAGMDSLSSVEFRNQVLWFPEGLRMKLMSGDQRSKWTVEFSGNETKLTPNWLLVQVSGPFLCRNHPKWNSGVSWKLEWDVCCHIRCFRAHNGAAVRASERLKATHGKIHYLCLLHFASGLFIFFSVYI